MAVASDDCTCPMPVFGKKKNEAMWPGQKPYDGSDTFETSAATSKARFERYNEIRKAHKELQTSAASYGWLRASIKSELVS